MTKKMVAVWTVVTQEAGFLVCVCGSFSFMCAHCLACFAFLLLSFILHLFNIIHHHACTRTLSKCPGAFIIIMLYRDTVKVLWAQPYLKCMPC